MHLLLLCAQKLLGKSMYSVSCYCSPSTDLKPSRKIGIGKSGEGKEGLMKMGVCSKQVGNEWEKNTKGGSHLWFRRDVWSCCKNIVF